MGRREVALFPPFFRLPLPAGEAREREEERDRDSEKEEKTGKEVWWQCRRKRTTV